MKKNKKSREIEKVVFTREVIDQINSGRYKSPFSPWAKRKTAHLVDKHLKDTIDDICEKAGLGSIYPTATKTMGANYIDFLLYDKKKHKINEDGENDIDGLFVYLSYVSNYYIVGEGRIGFGKDYFGCSPLDPDSFDEFKSADIQKMATKVVELLNINGFQQLSRQEIEPGLPSDYAEWSLLGGGRLQYFDILFYAMA